ncbi:MAG: hypothetical protein ABIH37_01280 [archaeon]
MDQIYIPKLRANLPIGTYVIIKPLKTTLKGNKEEENKLHFYNIKSIEPLKLQIINQIIKIIDHNSQDYENIIITGSFLEKGFSFNDIDILLITNNKTNINLLQKTIEKQIQIKLHIISLDNKTLIKGISSDPLYELMLSKYISKKRFIHNTKRKINYKILDLHLLKSKSLINNFDILSGNEKYYLTRNTTAISQFFKNKEITKNIIDKEIEKTFNIKINEIKQNLIEKKSFLKKYKTYHNQIFNKIMKEIKNDSKQK